MANVLWIFGLIASFVDLGSARIEGFCNLDSCQGKEHTLCKYEWLTTSDACGQVVRAGPTQDEVDAIINAHNELRQRVAQGKETRGNPGPQPAATNMGMVEWDNDLSGVAQTWADQCVFGHDACRNLPAYAVGQNIAWTQVSMSENEDLTELIKSWYEEVVNVDRNMVSAYDDSNRELYGHYTQLVWAKSTKVGCGVIYYSTEEDKKQVFLVCNYGPAGNYQGEPLYETA